jgi:hypothetical protein
MMCRLQQKMLLALSLVTVTGCVHEINEAVQSSSGNGNQWAGPVVPTVPDCGSQTTGLMTLSSKEFSFAPFSGVVVIQGKVDKDHLEDSSNGGALGQKSTTIQFTGTINHPTNGPPTIEGTTTSGRCTWSVTLHRG